MKMRASQAEMKETTAFRVDSRNTELMEEILKIRKLDTRFSIEQRDKIQKCIVENGNNTVLDRSRLMPLAMLYCINVKMPNI